MLQNRTVIREHLARTLSLRLSIKLQDANKYINTLISCITNALIQGKIVKLRGFGSFIIFNRKERIGINLKTGEKMIIGARKAIRFKTSTILKNSINNDIYMT